LNAPGENKSFKKSSLVPRHVAAAFGTVSAGIYTVFHAAQLLAASRTGLTNLGADRTELAAVARTAQHEICGRLTDFGAIHHQAEMLGFHMFASRLQAVHHGCLHTCLITIVACVNTRLHRLVGRRVHEHENLLIKFNGLGIRRAKITGK
jgi:hypothetical protein